VLNVPVYDPSLETTNKTNHLRYKQGSHVLENMCACTHTHTHRERERERERESRQVMLITITTILSPSQLSPVPQYHTVPPET
jgi:ABC-type nickel/cobalt efflux system permease component RcnA